MESGTIPLQNTIAVSKTFNFNGLTPDDYGWLNASVDFSDNIPANATFISASLKSGGYVYFVPYINPTSGEIRTFIRSYNPTSRKVTVGDKQGGWGDVIMTALFRLP